MVNQKLDKHNCPQPIPNNNYGEANPTGLVSIKRKEFNRGLLDVGLVSVFGVPFVVA